MTDKNGETSVLRGRLRSEWPAMVYGELVWVEHAAGGTVGAPDVFVPLGARGYLPVELKGWEVGVHSGLPLYTARPSQRRFHSLAGIAGQRTAFLAILPSGKVVTCPGHPFGLDAYVEVVNGRLGCIREIYNSDKFWRGFAR